MVVVGAVTLAIVAIDIAMVVDERETEGDAEGGKREERRRS